MTANIKTANKQCRFYKSTIIKVKRANKHGTGGVQKHHVCFAGNKAKDGECIYPLIQLLVKWPLRIQAPAIGSYKSMVHKMKKHNKQGREKHAGGQHPGQPFFECRCRKRQVR